ncbi:MAG TPA: DNA-directed RNA polymerase subunit D [Candidatus Lokiarchaeia archaeon]|nr:DNA-directed RNA polymerase subunit D [Candidatus Lokiarchaeia archaeon]
MNVEILEKSDNYVEFIMDGVTVEFANALRRLLLSEIPVMAIDEVIFLENSSPLFDEIIAHRLGLVPLKTDLKRYNLPKECSCGGVGCTLCQVELNCEITAENEDKVIYTGNLESNDPYVVPVSEKIPIVKLGKGKSVVLEAYARLGIGKQHAKWQAVATTAYRYYPDWSFDETKWDETNNEISPEKVCPPKVLYREGDKIFMVDDGWRKCNLCMACQKADKSGAVNVKKNPTKFIFFVEGTGALPVQEVLSKAIEIFQKALTEFDSQLAELVV